MIAEYGVEDGSTIPSHVAKENFMLATAAERPIVAEYYQRVFGKDLPESVVGKA